MSITAKFLKEFQFTHTHDILNDGDIPKFKVINAIPQDASVYMWLSPLGDSDFEVLYIGKAGYGVKNRFAQHESGFKNSNTGRANCELIQKHIGAGGTISVFARNSESQKLFGFDVNIPLYSAEEEALCEQFNPLWNRAKFPSKAKKNRNKTEANQAVQIAEDENHLVLPIDFLDIARGEVANDFYMSQDQKARNQFLDVLSLIADTPELAMLQQKIVGGYSEQPKGYNNIPLINYALIHKSGRAVGDSWGIRVPLINTESAPLTVILPRRFLNPQCDPSSIEWGPRDSFRPKDLADFIKNKSKYIVI